MPSQAPASQAGNGSPSDKHMCMYMHAMLAFYWRILPKPGAKWFGGLWHRPAHTLLPVCVQVLAVDESNRLVRVQPGALLNEVMDVISKHNELNFRPEFMTIYTGEGMHAAV